MFFHIQVLCVEGINLDCFHLNASLIMCQWKTGFIYFVFKMFIAKLRKTDFSVIEKFLLKMNYILVAKNANFLVFYP